MGRKSMQKKRSHEINSQLLMIMENYCLNSLSRSSHFIMPSSFFKIPWKVKGYCKGLSPSLGTIRRRISRDEG